ncbi:MAG: hypothetical protein H6935_11785 [Thiobacillus sp.]|nr:hypothetical protein [Thiobacillus sp.]
MGWLSTFFVGLVVVAFSLTALAFIAVAVVVLGEALVLAFRALKTR